MIEIWLIIVNNRIEKKQDIVEEKKDIWNKYSLISVETLLARYLYTIQQEMPYNSNKFKTYFCDAVLKAWLTWWLGSFFSIRNEIELMIATLRLWEKSSMKFVQGRTDSLVRTCKELVA